MLFLYRVDDLLGTGLESTHQSLDFREAHSGGTSLGGGSGLLGPASLTSSVMSSSGGSSSGGSTGGGGGGGGGNKPGVSSLPPRTCPSMPLTPDMDGDNTRPSPPRSQSQPSDLTQVR